MATIKDNEYYPWLFTIKNIGKRAPARNMHTRYYLYITLMLNDKYRGDKIKCEENTNNLSGIFLREQRNDLVHYLVETTYL